MGPSRYRELGQEQLPAPLRGLVECAWRAEVGPADVAHEQRVLPDGCMDLILSGEDLLVAGPDTTAHLALQRPGVAVTGLRFRPGYLPALLGVPASGLRDRRVELAELAPRGTRTPAPAGAPGTGRSDLARLLDVVVALRRAAGERRGADRGPLPRAALELLRRGATAATVAEDLGCTTRTLHRHCLDTLGYGPATIRRVLRFRAASDLLHAGLPPAEAAARAGYADQPHLSREVRALAGISPTRLLPGT